MIDGIVRLKNETELKKLLKPVKERQLTNEIGSQYACDLGRLEKKVDKLAKQVTALQNQVNKVIAKAILMDKKLNV